MLNTLEIIEKGLWPPQIYEPAYIEGFSHWYDSENIDRIDSALNSFKEKKANPRFLDIGFGNPIVLERAMKQFENCNALYITLEKALNHKIEEAILHKGNCYSIPFQKNEFDIISAYAYLHIIPDIKLFFENAYALLNNQGILYTDGDKNIYITKFVRPIKLLQYKITGNSKMYNHWKSILQPKGNYHQEGIDFILLRKELKKIGFSKVIINPWVSSNPEFNKNIIYRVFKRIITTFKLSIFSTHIQIIAIK